MRLLIIMFLFAWPALGQQPKPKTCTPAGETQHTIWGNLPVNYDRQTKPIKAVKGTVEGWSVSAKRVSQEGVLVEIYPYRVGEPTRIPDDPDRSRPRVYACVTGANGAFDFDLPSGRYEIIASKKDHRATTVLVAVDRKQGESKPLKIPIEVGM